MEPSNIVTPIEREEARSWETKLLSEVALRESGEHYRFLYNKTPVMLHSVDSRGLLVSVSDYWLEVLGYERSEVLGQPSVNILTEASREYTLSTCLPEFMKTGYLKDEPLQYQKKNGEVIDILLSAVGDRDEEGNIVHSLAVSIDVSERRRLEAAILEISEREQRRLGEDLHDDVGQTLNGVWFMSGLLKKKLEAKQLPEAASAERISDLLERVLNQLRGLVRGLNAVDLSSDDLVPALNEYAAGVEQIYRSNGVSCSVKAENEPAIPTRQAATQLYRIAQEAVTNAIKHGKASQIDIHLSSANNTTQLSVRDNGIGIPEPSARGKGSGLKIMDHRARVINATVQAQRLNEGGTLITCVLSLPPSS